MNYFMNLLHNFVSNAGELLQGTFGSAFSSSSGSLESTLPTVTYGTATSSTLEGTTDLGNDKETTGSLLITTGSALTSAVNDMPNIDVSAMQSQAYVESMSDEELEEFIVRLEGANVVEYDIDKTLAKTIDSKNI